MGRIIGIDLGTTYSAVSIPEERSGDGFFVIPACPGYAIILDKFKRRITPSVVAEDERGEIVTGYPAKARAGLSPEPIMFAKRWMGEEKNFQLDKQGALLPVDVSAHILRHLKAMAEERLGESVEEAIITVPAYFSLKAKQMTEEAGKMAGLQVAQIAQEPVAAALMYCIGERRDPLRIMTYDLGGGTFDVAILEKRDGIISTDSIKAFDGDRFLGGYDFDKSLAFWIMEQLNGQRYNLQLDLENPSDKVLFAKLMVYAERAKIELSKSEYCEIQEPSTGITDHSGNPVAIHLSITRDEFEAMISTQIEYTIQLCRRAMEEKANPPIRTDQIDEIIMVGGSSRIPLIPRRLEEEFGRKPRLIEPDLCVALGAAILAGTKPKTVGCLKLDPIPTETDLPNLMVTGRVVPGDGLTAVEGCKVTLRAMDGSYRNSRITGEEGAFLFDAVPLALENATDFVLSVTSPGGVELAGHHFSVAQKREVTSGGLVEEEIGTNMLSKPIGILLVDGLHIIAPERTPLPYETVVQAETVDKSGQIRVPVLEENNPLGEILMTDIPTTLNVGSEVEVKLTIQKNYQIHGRAYIPSLAREEPVVINIPTRPQKSLKELRSNYEELSERAKDALDSAGRSVLFGDARAKRLNERMKECEKMLQNENSDPAVIQDRMDEIESLVRDIGAGWRPEPPRAVFNQKAKEAEELLAQAIEKKPEVAQDGYDKQLEAIRTEAERAYTAQNTAAWKDSYNKVVGLCDRLEEVVESGKGGGGGTSPPAEILIDCARDLVQLERWAKEHGRYEKFKREFEEVAKSLKQIDPNAADAITQIRDWCFTKFDDLRQRLEAPETEGYLKLIGVRGNV